MSMENDEKDQLLTVLMYFKVRQDDKILSQKN